MKAIYKIAIVFFVMLALACNRKKALPVIPDEMEKNPNMMHLTAHEIIVINLKTDTARIRTIFETSDFVGTAVSDENNIFSISARVNGRLDQLFVRNPGEEISKGQPLYSIYSEELLSEENEFLLSLQQQAKFSDQEKTVDILVESSRKKLLLWGLTEQQINELAKNRKTSPTNTFYSDATGYLAELYASEGEYVTIGKPLFKIASLQTVWINAEIYQDELPYLYNNPQMEVRFEALPNQVFNGEALQNLPVLDQDKKIATVRILVQNKDRKIKPGMMATVTVRRNPTKTLVIPKSALIIGKMIKIWIETAPGMYENRMVETGIENKSEVEIRSGIKEGDRVVISGSYLLNSAFILKNGDNSMAGMKM